MLGDTWAAIGVIISGLSLVAVVGLGLWALGLAHKTLETNMASVAATEESTRISKKAAEASVLAAEVARQGAEMARRDVHRRRLEQVVDLIERIMVLARRVYNVDPLSGHILGSDESARAPLQAALVSLRTFVGALPDLLPKVKELSELGARENIGVQQVQGHYLYALDEVRNALIALEEEPQASI